MNPSDPQCTKQSSVLIGGSGSSGDYCNQASAASYRYALDERIEYHARIVQRLSALRRALPQELSRDAENGLIDLLLGIR